MDKKKDAQLRARSKLKSSYSTLLQNQSEETGGGQSLSYHHSTSSLPQDERPSADDGKDLKRNVFVRSVTSTIDCYPSSSGQGKPEMKHHLEEVFFTPSKPNYIME